MSVEVRYFADFELDPDAYRLSRNGEVVRLERIPLELLCLLVDGCGRVVSRDEILERIWGKGVFIDSEHAINTAVRKIRRALNDDADAPRFIVTIPGKGYRFVAPVIVPNGELKPSIVANGEPKGNENGQLPVDRKSADFLITPAVSDENQPRWRRHQLIGLLSVAGLGLVAGAMAVVVHLSRSAPITSASKISAGLPIPQLPVQPSIAVLPFINLSGDREQEYFSDGITNDLITDLARLPGLFVIARDSAFTYKGRVAKLQDVSRELGVRYVLAGSVRKTAGQLRITAQLADATTGTELWAERYSRPLRDVFALQDEIIRRIVTTLNLQLALLQQGVLIPRSTENLEAYDDLLRGEKYLVSYTKDGNAKARQMFKKAIELDPKYALAYALLGINYNDAWAQAFDPDHNSLERALQIEQQAIALDDSLPLAHSAIALIYSVNGRYDQAATEAQRGIALDPNSALAYLVLADVLNNQWKPAEALAAVDMAMRLDPRNPNNYVMWIQGRAYSLRGQYKEAISALKRYLASHPDFLWAHAWLVFDYSFLGDEDGARAQTAEVEQAIALNPNAALGYAALALALNAQGRPAEALMAIEKAMRLDPRPGFFPFEQGCAYTLLGRSQESITALKRFLAHYPEDFWVHAYLAVDHMELGHDDAARAEAAEALRLNPQLTVETVFPAVSIQRKALPAETERFRAALRKAGLK